MEAYQVRFLKEYQELCDRYGKLLKMLRNGGRFGIMSRDTCYFWWHK